MPRSFLYILLFLFTVGKTVAQPARQYTFTHFTTAHGLASNSVLSVVQDRNGYIWLASINGLQRYDGSKFLTFRSQENNPGTIPTDHIPTLHMDRQNRMWVISVDNKLGLFDTQRFKYNEVPVRYRSLFKMFHGKHLFEGLDGSLLMFVAQDGLYRYMPNENVFVPVDNLIPKPQGWSLTLVHADKESSRYVMSCDSGLAVYNPSSKQLSYRGHNVENDPLIEAWGSERYTWGIFPASGKRYYFHSWAPGAGGGSLLYYNAQSGEKKRYNLGEQLGYHEIYGFIEQSAGRVWVFGLKFVAEHTGGEIPFSYIRNEYSSEQSIKFDGINSMFEDRERNVWISTPNGLYIFNPDAQTFNPYNLVRPNGSGVVEGTVSAAAQLTNGDIWVCAWGNGLYVYDKEFTPKEVPRSLEKYKNVISVWDIQQHTVSGRVWLAMQQGALLVYNPATGLSERYDHPIFEGRTIRQVAEDMQGNLWFGTQHGSLIKWDLKASGGDPGKGYVLIQKMGLVHRIICDEKGFIWAAGMIDGFYKIDPATDKVVTKIRPDGPNHYRLQGPNAFDMLQYNDSIMVFSSGPLDILNTNTGQISHINANNGLPSNNVLSMVKDNKGAIWLGLGYGLCRLNLDWKVVTFYDSRDGIVADNFKVAGVHKMLEGNLIFYTQRNFLVFNPDKMVYSMVPPNVKFTDIKVMNKSLYLDSVTALKKLTLNYEQNSVVFEFSGLTYLKQNKIFYYYMLEGLDKEWIPAEGRTQAVYNYLGSGNYTFKVKCENVDGIPSNSITILNVRVQPPFWQTWWFYGLIAMAAIGIFYWFDKERIGKIFALQQVRTQIAGNLHQDISTTLSNINLLSELAKIKADKDLSKSKEFIDQINEKSKKMMDAMDDMLWSIQPENDSMQKTLDRMTEFVHGLRKTHEIEVDMIVDERVKMLKLDMKSRLELFIIFKEALNNVVLHSEASEVLINIDLVKNALSLNIHDNGEGFDEHSVVHGTGIEEMRKRAHALNAQLHIQSDKRGTAVLLKVPV